uniref:Pheromone binding protein 1 n=1 Tax=Dendrolimus kikuchii TaxID=765133 RepID=A0A0D3L4D6_9NEOP|nr:pheromone binding protein 1 [Dendrolimus kikuchii]
MTKTYTFLAVAIVFLAIDSRVDSSQDVMKDLSVKFGESMNQCIKEMDLPDVSADVFNYWKEDFVITRRETGCLFSCLAKKVNMQHSDGLVHKDNTHKFAMKHGADAEMATKLVDIIHTCQNSISESDDCLRVMGIANCFKKEVHKLDWAPSADLVTQELMAII